jgi:hypothetical protein
VRRLGREHIGEHGPVMKAWVRDAGDRRYYARRSDWRFLREWAKPETDLGE